LAPGCRLPQEQVAQASWPAVAGANPDTPPKKKKLKKKKKKKKKFLFDLIRIVKNPAKWSILHICR
jgi:hypothetical protein